MAWLKIDDRVRTHPKIAKAGPSAAWLWFCGICYCREHLSDGFIPNEVVSALALNLPSPSKHAAKLVDVRLWEPADGGYQVHNFLDWNPSKAEVLSLRDKERDKKRTYRGTDEGQTRDASRDHAGARGSGSVSRLGSDGFGEESARETAPRSKPIPIDAELAIEFAQPMPPLINGAEIRRHGMHAWCSDRGLCVPMGLHTEFKARLGADDAHVRLKAWYPTVVAKYAGQPVGDDLFAFWRNEFAAWVGTVTAPVALQKPSRGARTAHAFDLAAEMLAAQDAARRDS